MCSDFLAESLVIRKLQGSKITFSKILARKRLPKILDELFQGKNHLKMGNYTIFYVQKSQDMQTSTKFNNKNFENSRSQIVFRTDIFRKLSLGAPDLCNSRPQYILIVVKRLVVTSPPGGFVISQFATKGCSAQKGQLRRGELVGGEFPRWRNDLQPLVVSFKG